MLCISAVTPQRLCFASSGEAPQDLRAVSPGIPAFLTVPGLSGEEHYCEAHGAAVER